MASFLFKLRAGVLRQVVEAILQLSLQEKKRDFLETIELQVRLKGYNIQKTNDSLAA
jgi:ribosomal protein L1